MLDEVNAVTTDVLVGVLFSFCIAIVLTRRSSVVVMFLKSRHTISGGACSSGRDILVERGEFDEE